MPRLWWFWIKDLFSSAPSAAWTIASAASTVLTFVAFLPFKFSGPVRTVAFSIAALTFCRANYLVFKRQRSRIIDLDAQLATRDARVSQLMIRPGQRSRYILTAPPGIPNADFNGVYLEFRLRVENRGRRNSIVERFDVEIRDLKQAFPRLLPDEGRRMVQGRRSQYGLAPESALSAKGIFQVAPESSTEEGTLAFLIPNLIVDVFANAGLRMHGEERRFGTLHCRLTITDSTGATASADFEMSES